MAASTDDLEVFTIPTGPDQCFLVQPQDFFKFLGVKHGTGSDGKNMKEL
jgi:hypothetical protein